ncbi:DUF4350 domain-containing protein [Cesiribacter sp. SM1]|uniref:DUF4350 domain-containing protein n=1 Tax=Cesiribacter sp. SM1 TaxID=2861196 RepID=UPI001CD4B06E|nr:DUF4350 domain-containing protein [Cesiribacter sp. SM1]
MSRRRILILAGVVLLFVVIEMLMPRPLNWSPTYSHRDKNPYGAYVLAQLLPGLLAPEELRIQSVTLYETDSVQDRLNLLVLSEDFMPEEEDLEVLLRRVAKGDHAFISAQFWSEEFSDTLGFTYVYNFELPAEVGGRERDSSNVQFTQAGLPRQRFRFANSVLASTFDSLPPTATVLAKTDGGAAILVSVPWGSGTMFLSSTPLLFTNYYLMQERSRPFSEAALAYLPEQTLFWTEYYHLGRMEANTPLRFILQEPALRWSYYLGMGILLGFVLFSLKRRQRPIPVVAPPANTSLQFAETVARLYYSQGNHLDIAHKKISYFKEWLRERYQMPAGRVDEDYLQRLARKSGKPEAEVRSLFAFIERIQRQASLSPEDLLALQHKLESFTRS